MAKRVMMAAARGIPKNAATLVATVEYEGVIVECEWLMTFMKKIARGANKTICRIELMATRIAQYCSRIRKDGNKTRTLSTYLGIASRKTSPDQYHGDTTSNTHQNQTFTKARLVWKERP
jgi:hypothetical protein